MGVLGQQDLAQYKPRNSWRNGVLALYGRVNGAEPRTFSYRVPGVVVPSFVGAPVGNFALRILVPAKRDFHLYPYGASRPILSGIPQVAPPGCRRWRHKGRTSTNPAPNRYGRSRSAQYRADRAIGNPAQWSFPAPRAHPGLGSAHLSCRAIWMVVDRPPSWRQRGSPQPVDEAQDLSQQRSWDPGTSYVR